MISVTSCVTQIEGIVRAIAGKNKDDIKKIEEFAVMWRKHFVV